MREHTQGFDFAVLPVIDLDDNDNILVPLPAADKIQTAEGQRFCDDPTCSCKQDQNLINTVNLQYLAGLITPSEGTRIYLGLVI